MMSSREKAAQKGNLFGFLVLEDLGIILLFYGHQSVSIIYTDATGILKLIKSFSNGVFD